MEGIRPPAPLLATPGKPLTSWSAWLSDFEVYAMAIGWTDWGEQRRQALLLHCVGQEARRLFRAECPTGVPSQGGVEPKFEGRAATMSLVDATVDVLSRLFEKKSDVITERVLFRKCTQGQTTVRTFLANLRERSQRCAFGALEDEMIRDQFLEGCSSARLRERLCREDDLTLPRLEVVALAEDQALERQQAVGRLQTAAAEREHAPVSVAATATKRYAHGTRSMTPLSRRKVGHFWRCCPKKGEKTAGEKPVASVQVLSVAVTSPTEDTRPYIQLKVAGKWLKFVVDSGIAELVGPSAYRLDSGALVHAERLTRWTGSPPTGLGDAEQPQLSDLPVVRSPPEPVDEPPAEATAAARTPEQRPDRQPDVPGSPSAAPAVDTAAATRSPASETSSSGFEGAQSDGHRTRSGRRVRAPVRWCP
ncbi:hypothetical protein FJT64_025303 [Amphibalanus amphitrite]|uniref:Retrotransposon gag domain-containing protein n=1 Tax=Amphibalanus amphitrite TaxID=1232801 RepID=A0A6A4WK86_AMPAM|nr:hypothetical protein FJT64_025303 [Amphibalanus amphitrite]